MCGRSLPNYDKYMQRLETFAKILGIKIEYGQEDGEGSFSPSHRKIKLDTDLQPSEEVATLLHELGHAIDDMLVDKTIERSINAAYSIIYDTKGTVKQRDIVMNCEKRAWHYGRKIAKQLKIKLGKWYRNQELDCLRRYRDAS